MFFMVKSFFLSDFSLGILFVATCLAACTSSTPTMNFNEIQITFDKKGHTIHNTQVFSPDDQWVVFDSRNYDSLIGSTELVKLVNIQTKEIKTLYQTKNQTTYGPGVGAVTFSPTQNRVIFIHGIRNADKENPYSMTRRTGVAIETDSPFQPLFMDARDITPPFTPGALRGGTHAHSWSADGKWISFTYNDCVIKQLSETDSSLKDLRMIGVMAPGKVEVPYDSTLENNSGEMFLVVVTMVTEHPRPGTDEIDKAFDEGWIGRNGYLKPDGTRQQRAIAFQGNVRNNKGETITEVFVVDLPEDITVPSPGKPLEGTANTRPAVPKGTVQRRITYTEAGIEGPRHWLRTTSEGGLIAYLAKDENGIIQIYAVSPNGGDPVKITNNLFSVQGPFNFSPDGKYIAYNGDNSVFITDLKTQSSFRLTERKTDEEKPVGAPVWSNKGDIIAYNR